MFQVDPQGIRNICRSHYHRRFYVSILFQLGTAQYGAKSSHSYSSKSCRIRYSSWQVADFCSSRCNLYGFTGKLILCGKCSIVRYGIDYFRLRTTREVKRKLETLLVLQKSRSVSHTNLCIPMQRNFSQKISNSLRPSNNFHNCKMLVIFNRILDGFIFC